MSQSTGQVSGVDFKLEISDDGGSTWNDISGSVTSVEPSGGERQYGKAYTADGNAPVLGFGKDNEVTLNVLAIYTETAGEAYQRARAVVENRDTDVQLRWSPGGGNVGDEQFTTTSGAILNPMLPKVDAGDANPLAISFQFVCASVAAAVVT